MPDYLSTPCTAFAGTDQLARGALIDVALAVKAAAPADDRGPVLTFDDATGAVLDLDLRGTTAEIVSRLTEHGELEALATRTRSRSHDPGPGSAPARARGRPKLGVVAREVTLLPRHWEWLAAQPGGASQMLRRLVDDARRSDGGRAQAKAGQERAYRFLTALAGDLPGFEEVIRALFAGDGDAFAERMAAWPTDIRNHAMRLAHAALQQDAPA